PEEMRLIEKGKFCIDQYEYPNKNNNIPLTNVTIEEAELLCKKENKRLCSSSEWESACKGEIEDLKFPYGNSFSSSNCNTAGNPIIKNSIAPSGKFSECKNSHSIFDMSGNVAEWVRSDKKESYAYGGSWQSGENESRCNSKILLKKSRKYFYVGFRCCK
ncbi:MAG: SUMF1/EgtB/PvdO family nonheme iron enzyme, partial [Chitinispirillaceae bacterium]|nr:SUMF1/EgtB/PvdO family nonheme iron enzyme [Chitinispirillaceae bacterium]